MRVKHEFMILSDFLSRFGPEVWGHEISAPHEEAVRKLRRFAIGECDPPERAEVCELLRLHPAWLRWLADRVKTARDIAGTDPLLRDRPVTP